MLIFWRLFPLVVAINIAVIVLFIGFSVLQFNRISAELERERVTVLGDRVAAPFEAAAGIGLPPSSVRNMDSILERARQMNEAIVSVHLLDSDGVVIRSAGGKSETVLDAEILDGLMHGEQRTWSGETDDGYFSATRIVGLGGNLVGALVIRYSGARGSSRSWAMAAQLTLGGFASLLFASLMTAAGLRIALRREIAEFDRIDAAIGSFERDSWRNTDRIDHPLMEGEAGTGDDLGTALHEVEARYREAVSTSRHGAGQS
ncbi:MAG: hypothetical protein PVI79_18190 [Gammaproteobacteria bacterium]|jgi:hypothetical protein